MDKDLLYLDTYLLQDNMCVKMPEDIIKALNLEKGKSRLNVYLDECNKCLVIEPEILNKIAKRKDLFKDLLHVDFPQRDWSYWDAFKNLCGVVERYEALGLVRNDMTRCKVEHPSGDLRAFINQDGREIYKVLLELRQSLSRCNSDEEYAKIMALEDLQELVKRFDSILDDKNWR